MKVICIADIWYLDGGKPTTGPEKDEICIVTGTKTRNGIIFYSLENYIGFYVCFNFKKPSSARKCVIEFKVNKPIKETSDIPIKIPSRVTSCCNQGGLNIRFPVNT